MPNGTIRIGSWILTDFYVGEGGENDNGIVKSSGEIKSEEDCKRLCAWYKNGPRWDYVSCRRYCDGHPISREELETDEFDYRKRMCKHCGKPFMPEYANQLYDYKICRSRMNNKKHKQRKEVQNGRTTG